MESSWATRKCPGGGQATSKGEAAQLFNIFLKKEKEKKRTNIFVLFIYIFIIFCIFFIVMETCRLPIECDVAD